MTTQPLLDPADQSSNAGGSGDSNQEPRTVSFESHQKLLDEKKKIQQRLREFEAAEEKRQQELLEKQGKFEELSKKKDEELQAAREKLTTLERREQDRLKMAHLLDAIGGYIDPKFYRHIDHIDEIVIDPETGEIDKMTVAKAAEKLRAEYPEFIQSKDPRLPQGAPSGGGADRIKRDDWMKLSPKDMKKWKPSQIMD